MRPLSHPPSGLDHPQHTSPSPRGSRLVLPTILAAITISIVGACIINPQPEPPGSSDDRGASGSTSNPSGDGCAAGCDDDSKCPCDGFDASTDGCDSDDREPCGDCVAPPCAPGETCPADSGIDADDAGDEADSWDNSADGGDGGEEEDCGDGGDSGDDDNGGDAEVSDVVKDSRCTSNAAHTRSPPVSTVSRAR